MLPCEEGTRRASTLKKQSQKRQWNGMGGREGGRRQSTAARTIVPARPRPPTSALPPPSPPPLVNCLFSWPECQNLEGETTASRSSRPSEAGGSDSVRVNLAFVPHPPTETDFFPSHARSSAPLPCYARFYRVPRRHLTSFRYQ